MSSQLVDDIVAAVDQQFEQQVDFLQQLVQLDSTRGNEQAAQEFMAEALKKLQYKLDVWHIKLEDIEHLPGFSPVAAPYEYAENVVASHEPREIQGKSLILNGHIDVVPIGPRDMWHSAPYSGHVEGGWLYGRGSGDMKAGLAANLFALQALKNMGYQPAAKVIFQSVVEEECTGNGALACLARGYTADAVLIPEPFAEILVSAQVGVLWFQVHIEGLPTHVAYASQGANAIEGSIPIISALHGMEQRWNETQHRHAAYCHHGHALNLNIGRIEGGDWTSSVPAWCRFDVRMGLFPGQDMAQAKQDIIDTVIEAAQGNDFLRSNPPSVIFEGFQAEGYVLEDDNSENALDAIAKLEQAHQQINGQALLKKPITATTDGRFFGLYGHIPALVYGPKASAIHGFNEAVELESMRRVTQTTALFIAQWCGLEKCDD
jgi:acetylornithine deacetylase